MVEGAKNADDPVHLALGVRARQSEGFHRDGFALAVDEAMLEVELAPILHHLVHMRLDVFKVIFVIVIERFLITGFETARVLAMDTKDLVGPVHGLVFEVQRPVTNFGDLLQKQQLLQRVLGLIACLDHLCHVCTN